MHRHQVPCRACCALRAVPLNPALPLLRCALLHSCRALQACDNLMLTREAISAVAHRHGLAATALPKLWAGVASNGAHAHLSIWKVGFATQLARGYMGREAP